MDEHARQADKVRTGADGAAGATSGHSVEDSGAPSEMRASRRPGFRALSGIVAAVLVASAILVLGWTGDGRDDRGLRMEAGLFPGSPAEARPGEDEREVDEDALDERDEEHRRAILGSWERDDYYGRVVLTLREGGSGTMEILFNTFYSYLVAERVVADLDWKVGSGRAVFRALRGRPAGAFKLITQSDDAHRDRKILEINEQRMLLEDDLDKGSIAEWKRLE